MGAVTTLAALSLQIKGAIRTALNNLAAAIDLNTTKITSIETLRDTGGLMVYKGTGDALPASPKTGWVFKVNTTSAALEAAPDGAGNGDFILYNGTAWELMIDVSFGV